MSIYLDDNEYHVSEPTYTNALNKITDHLHDISIDNIKYHYHDTVGLIIMFMYASSLPEFNHAKFNVLNISNIYEKSRKA